MAAVNSDAADLIDVTNLPLNKLIRQKEETEAEVAMLCNLMYLLNKARLKYESSVEYVNKLNSSMEGASALIPLTNNLYVQGDICKLNKMVVNFGGDYQAEMDKDSAINHFFRKIQNIKAKIGMAQKILAEKILDRERLRKAAAEKYLQEKRKGEMKSLPKFLTG